MSIMKVICYSHPAAAASHTTTGEEIVIVKKINLVG